MIRRTALLAVLIAACGTPSSDTDGGPRTDARAAPDAAPPDGGRRDAGPARDGGPRDGGRRDGGPREDSDGGTVGCGAGSAATGLFHREAVDGTGRTRNYDLLVPAGYDPETPVALTFVYHGAGGNEDAARAFGLEDAVGADSILVFPRGIPYASFGVGWDDHCGGYDMPFFDAMLDAIEDTYCIDPDRVFAAGFSWGCDHVTALACCRGDRIRAVAPASCADEFGDAADPETYDNLPCPVPTAAAIRFTHATTADDGYPAPYFTTTSALYRSFAACSAESTAVAPSPCVAYDDCAVPYLECAYNGLGHTLPAGWATDTWAFFDSFR